MKHNLQIKKNDWNISWLAKKPCCSEIQDSSTVKLLRHDAGNIGSSLRL